MGHTCELLAHPFGCVIACPCGVPGEGPPWNHEQALHEEKEAKREQQIPANAIYSSVVSSLMRCIGCWWVVAGRVRAIEPAWLARQLQSLINACLKLSFGLSRLLRVSDSEPAVVEKLVLIRDA